MSTTLALGFFGVAVTKLYHGRVQRAAFVVGAERAQEFGAAIHKELFNSGLVPVHPLGTGARHEGA